MKAFDCHGKRMRVSNVKRRADCIVRYRECLKCWKTIKTIERLAAAKERANSKPQEAHPQ